MIRIEEGGGITCRLYNSQSGGYSGRSPVSDSGKAGEGISAYLSERRGFVPDQRLWKTDDGRVQYRSRRAGNDGKGPAF